MNPFTHPKFAEAQAAAETLAATIKHAVVNADRAPQAAREAGAWLAAGAPLADAATLAAREAACAACEHWKPTEPGGPMHCERCKCLRAKLAMATSACPVGKWGPVSAAAR